MPKNDAIGRKVRAVKQWMTKVTHQVIASGNTDARQPGGERRVQDLGRQPDRRNAADRRDLV
ncbi:MAG TPA: hypothetical protein VHP13_05125 [Gammaproteobacteria bacterium]|nr:hypothetical protein [Gammaproteobacteria bacterium]